MKSAYALKTCKTAQEEALHSQYWGSKHTQENWTWVQNDRKWFKISNKLQNITTALIRYESFLVNKWITWGRVINLLQMIKCLYYTIQSRIDAALHCLLIFDRLYPNHSKWMLATFKYHTNKYFRRPWSVKLCACTASNCRRAGS